MPKSTSDMTLTAAAAESIDSFDDLQKYFGTLNATRAVRERVRAAFLDKAKRTPKKARRWFRIDEIEPDPTKRALLIEQWRASIWHRDLMCQDKSQVLCLSPSPLAGSRLPPDLARGKHFNMIVKDLWMSAPRWLQWFSQIEIVPPKWLAFLAKPQSMMVGAPSESFEDATQPLPTSQRWIVKSGRTLTVGEKGVVEIVKELWPNGITCKAADRNKQIDERFEIRKFTRCSPSTIKRALQKVRLSDPK